MNGSHFGPGGRLGCPEGSSRFGRLTYSKMSNGMRQSKKERKHRKIVIVLLFGWAETEF